MISSNSYNDLRFSFNFQAIWDAKLMQEPNKNTVKKMLKFQLDPGILIVSNRNNINLEQSYF